MIIKQFIGINKMDDKTNVDQQKFYNNLQKNQQEEFKNVKPSSKE